MPGHQDFPLYIQFLRVHSLSKFLLYTNYHERGPRVIIIFSFFTPPALPPHSLSPTAPPSLSPSLPSSAMGGAGRSGRPAMGAPLLPPSTARPRALWRSPEVAGGGLPPPSPPAVASIPLSLRRSSSSELFRPPSPPPRCLLLPPPLWTAAMAVRNSAGRICHAGRALLGHSLRRHLRVAEEVGGAGSSGRTPFPSLSLSP